MNKRAVAINTIIQIAGKLFSIVVNLVIVYLLTHHYSLTQFGEYTAVFSYLLIFNILADLGLSTILVRDINAYDEKTKPQFIGNVILLRTTSLVFSLLIGIIIAQFIPQYDSVIKLGIIIGSLSTFSLLLYTLITSLFQIKLALQKAVYANAIGSIVNLILVYLITRTHVSIDWAVAALSISYSVMFLVSVYYAHTLEKISFVINPVMWRQILSQSITIGAAIIFSSIYFKSDSFILSLLKPYSAVSLYAVPYKILEVLIGIPQMFMAPVFALMARDIQDQRFDAFKQMLQKAIDLLILAAIPIIPGALFLSQKIIPLYAGAQYAPSIDLLKILSIAVFLSFLGSALIYVVLLYKKQHLLLMWNIFLSIFNITLNLIFIPKYSYYASAWITVITEFFVLSGSCYFVKKVTGYLPSFHILLKGVVSGICFTITLFLLHGTNLLIQTALALIVYVIALMLTKAIARDDIKEILQR